MAEETCRPQQSRRSYQRAEANSHRSNKFKSQKHERGEKDYQDQKKFSTESSSEEKCKSILYIFYLIHSFPEICINVRGENCQIILKFFYSGQKNIWTKQLAIKHLNFSKTYFHGFDSGVLCNGERLDATESVAFHHYIVITNCT